MTAALRLAILSALFVATSVGIVIKQRTATSCPRHSRTAGLMARALAAACLGVGLALAAMAIAVAASP